MLSDDAEFEEMEEIVESSIRPNGKFSAATQDLAGLPVWFAVWLRPQPNPLFGVGLGYLGYWVTTQQPRVGLCANPACKATTVSNSNVYEGNNI